VRNAHCIKDLSSGKHNRLFFDPHVYLSADLERVSFLKWNLSVIHMNGNNRKWRM